MIFLPILVSVLTFVATTAGTCLLAGLLFKHLLVPACLLALLTGGGVAWAVFGEVKQTLQIRETGLNLLDRLVMAVFGVFGSFAFAGIYFYHGQNILTSNKIHYSALSPHLALIFHLIKGGSFWPENPLVGGVPLPYSFGPELLLALLGKFGIPVTWLLPCAGILSVLLLIYALYLWGRAFAVAGFFLSGGMAGYQFLADYKLGDYDALQFWKNLFLNIFIPQWGFWYALPAGLLLLWNWRRKFFEEKPGLPFLAEIILFGVMPFFQGHTFWVLLIIYFVWSGFGSKARGVIWTYVGVLVIALPLFLRLTRQFTDTSVKWLHPQWLLQNQDPSTFLLINFGIFMPLSLIATGMAIYKKDRASILTAMPAFFLLTFCLLVMFASQPLDALPVAMWAYLLLLPVIGRYVIRRAWRYLRLALVILFCFSGTVSVAFFLQTGFGRMKLADRDRVDEICYAVSRLPVEGRFATAPIAYHPLIFCGRKIAFGIQSDLAELLPNSRIYEMHLANLMKGNVSWQDSARTLQAGFLFWGEDEARSYADSNRPWESENLKIREGAWGKIYDLSKPSPFAELGSGHPSQNPAAGLKAVYYHSVDWTGSPARQFQIRDVRLDFPDEVKDRGDFFSLVLDGMLYVPVSGAVRFYLASDDGSELAIDGRTIIQNLGIHPLRVRDAEMGLRGGWHSLRIRYFNAGGAATLRFWWKLPGRSEEKIPPEYFYTGKTSGENA